MIAVLPGGTRARAELLIFQWVPCGEAIKGTDATGARVNGRDYREDGAAEVLAACVFANDRELGEKEVKEYEEERGRE